MTASHASREALRSLLHRSFSHPELGDVAFRRFVYGYSIELWNEMPGAGVSLVELLHWFEGVWWRAALWSDTEIYLAWIAACPGEGEAIRLFASNQGCALPAADETNPYSGLAPVGDPARLFGREADIEALAACVRSQPITIVVGASGVGKTSLVRAGLVPRLAREGKVVRFDERDEHAHVLVFDGLQRAAAPLAGTRSTFVEAARAARTGGAHVVGVFRWDEVDALTTDGMWLAAPNLRFEVGPITREALQRLVMEPVRARGVSVDAAFLRTVTELHETDGATLPLVQAVLWEAWRRRGGGVLGGGWDAPATLASLCDRAFGELADGDKVEARRLVVALVGLDGAHARLSLVRTALPVPEPARARILDHLVAHRVLAIRHTKTEVTWQLTHDRLLRDWTALAEWVREDGPWERQRRMIAAAELRSRETGVLLSGMELKRAVAWLQERPAPESERRFVARSMRARRVARIAATTVALTLVTLAGLAVRQEQSARVARDTAALIAANVTTEDRAEEVALLRGTLQRGINGDADPVQVFEARQRLMGPILSSPLTWRPGFPGRKFESADLYPTEDPDLVVLVGQERFASLRLSTREMAGPWQYNPPKSFAGGTLQHHANPVVAKSLIVLAGCSLTRWDVRSGARLADRMLTGCEQYGAMDLATSADGSRVAVLPRLGPRQLLMFEGPDLQPRSAVEVPPSTYNVAVSPDGSRIAVTGKEMVLLRGWEDETWKTVRIEGSVRAASWSDDGGWLLLTTDQGLVRLGPDEQPRLLGTKIGSWIPGTADVLYVGADGAVEKVGPDNIVTQVFDPEGDVDSIVISSDGRHAGLFDRSSNVVSIWGLANGQREGRLDLFPARVVEFNFASDFWYATTRDARRYAGRLSDLPHLVTVKRYRASKHPGPPPSATDPMFGRDGSWFLGQEVGNRLVRRRASDGAVEWERPMGCWVGPGDLELVGDGSLLFTRCWAEYWILDVATGNAVVHFEGLPNLNQQGLLEVSADGRLGLWWQRGGGLLVTELTSNRVLHHFQDHSSGAFFGNDAVVTWSMKPDATIVRRLSDGLETVRDGRWEPSPDGTRLATRDAHGLRVIAANGRLITELNSVAGEGVKWSPDGTRLLLGGRSGTAGLVVDAADGAVTSLPKDASGDTDWLGDRVLVQGLDRRGIVDLATGTNHPIPDSWRVWAPRREAPIDLFGYPSSLPGRGATLFHLGAGLRISLPDPGADGVLISPDGSRVLTWAGTRLSLWRMPLALGDGSAEALLQATGAWTNLRVCEGTWEVVAESPLPAANTAWARPESCPVAGETKSAAAQWWQKVVSLLSSG